MHVRNEVGSRPNGVDGRRCAGRAAALAVAALVVVGGAAGCASSRESSVASSQKSAAPAEDVSGGRSGDAAVAGRESGAAPTAEGASLNADALGQVAPPVDRPVISTATLTVETDDVAGTKPRALAIVAAKGGYLFADESAYGEQATSTLTVKVPPAVFTETIEDLGRLGELRSQQVSSEDVTDQVIDLESRIAAAEGSLARTGELLRKATGLTDIRQLEDEFARRQVDLEKLRGQQKTLAGRIDFATIVLTLHGADDVTPALDPDKQPVAAAPGFFDGLDGGLAVAGTVGTFALAALGALLPFVPLAIVAYGVVRLVRWRSERRGPTSAAPAES
jgi:hypothetical protein